MKVPEISATAIFSHSEIKLITAGSGRPLTPLQRLFSHRITTITRGGKSRIFGDDCDHLIDPAIRILRLALDHF